MQILLVFVVACFATASATNVSLALFTESWNCLGSPDQLVNTTEMSCTFVQPAIGDGAAVVGVMITCDRHFADNHLIQVFQNDPLSCAPEALVDVNAVYTGECIGADNFGDTSVMSFFLSGCPSVVGCNNTVGQWTQWTASCGNAVRTRTVSCRFNDGYNSTCTTCAQVSTYEGRQYHCVGENEVISADYCNTTTKTCHVMLDNAGQFSTPSGFWRNTMFQSGWTMQIAALTLNGSIAFYTMLPETIAFDDITIAGDSMVPSLVVASHQLSISNGLGTCSLFRFTGRNITLLNLNIIVPESCFQLVPLDANMIFHGSSIQFSGSDLTMTNVIFFGPVVAFLIDSSTSIGQVRLNIGVGDQKQGVLRMDSGCWAGHIFANEGDAVIQTQSSECVTSVSYGSSALKVQTVGGRSTDATMVITQKVPVITPPTTRTNRATNALGTLVPLIVLSVAALILVFFVVYKILSYNQLFELDSKLLEKLKEMRASRGRAKKQT